MLYCTALSVHATFFKPYLDFTMDDNIAPREVGWTDSSNSDIILDLFTEELESNLLPSEEEEVPFVRHGLLVELDLEDLVIQRDFWSCCAIGFLLDYRKFLFCACNI